MSLEIPEEADRELLSLIATTARDLRHGLSAWANAALREDDALEFLQLGSEAKERQQDAELPAAGIGWGTRALSERRCRVDAGSLAQWF